MARPRKVQPIAADLMTPAQTERKPGECLGFFQYTGSNESFSLKVPEGTSRIIVQAERTAFRWTEGEDPAQHHGMRLVPDVERPFDSNLSRLKFIGQASGGILNVICYA